MSQSNRPSATQQKDLADGPRQDPRREPERGPARDLSGSRIDSRRLSRTGWSMRSHVPATADEAGLALVLLGIPSAYNVDRASAELSSSMRGFIKTEVVEDRMAAP